MDLFSVTVAPIGLSGESHWHKVQKQAIIRLNKKCPPDGTLLNPIGQPSLWLSLAGLYNKEVVTSKKDITENCSAKQQLHNMFDYEYDEDVDELGNYIFYEMTVEPCLYKTEHTDKKMENNAWKNSSLQMLPSQLENQCEKQF